jgi:hypothetical protein
VFSQPEIGTVGLTEAGARIRCAKVDIYKSQFRPLKHTLTGRDEKMLMKLVVDGDTDRVLGCHVMGPDAGEMAQLVGIAVKMGATKADFDATMAVHPTAAEELVTMRQKAPHHQPSPTRGEGAGLSSVSPSPLWGGAGGGARLRALRPRVSPPPRRALPPPRHRTLRPSPPRCR